jgi:hypothetical protein
MIPLVQQLFVDETKAKGFTFAVATLPDNNLKSARSRLKAMRSAGQRSLHFKNESTRRRRWILAEIHSQGWQAVVLQSSENNMRAARTHCIALLLGLAKTVAATKVTLELDQSLERYDRRDLYQLSRQIGLPESFQYLLLPRHAEPGLWVPDAVAWCFARGGSWRDRIQPILINFKDA